MGAVRDAVGAAGARLGLWLPLSGHSLDTSWGKAQGLEVASPRYYCMSGTNYNRLLRAQLAALMGNGVIDYFKHDFNFFWCGQTDHGHFPTKEQSTEANVNALLDLLRYEAGLHPKIFLAITTGIWPSPWWLPYIDTIWMGGGDHDYNRSIPASRGSAFEMNYRDGALYRMIVENEAAFPLPALMTHGVVDGRHTPYSMKQEDDEGWANYVMNYLGRGTLMREFYISPENLSQRRWEIMARAIRWARTLDGCMAHSRFILGDPNKAELFGYTGESNEVRYVSLRNPQLESRHVTLGALGMSNGVCEIVYPWHQALYGEAEATIVVPDEGVVQVVQRRGAQLDIPVVCGVRAEAVASSARATEYVVHMPEGGGNFTIVSPVRVRGASGTGVTAQQITGVWHGTVIDADSLYQAAPAAVQAEMTFSERGVLQARVEVPRGRLAKVRVVYHYRGSGTLRAERNGRAAPAETIQGEGWRMVTVPCVQGKNDIRVVVRNVHPAVSGVRAEAYVITETVLVPYRVRIEHERVQPRVLLERPVALLQDRVREARRAAEAMVSLGRPRGAGGVTHVTTDELARATAAVLMFERFDVNGGAYSNKQICINGVPIGILPENPPPLASWQATRMELPEAARAALQLDNVITVLDRTGDMYKLRGFRIMVTLPGGRRARTEHDGITYSTSLQWAHGEGEKLAVDGSPVSVLSF